MTHTKANIDQFVAELKLGLPQPRPGAEFAASGDIRRRKLSTILRSCHVRRAESAFLAALAERLTAEHIYSRPLLTEAGLKRGRWIEFALVRFRPGAMGFRMEKALRAFIEAAVGTYGPLASLTLKKTEYRLRSGRRIDLLCQEKGRNPTLVAIELKRIESVDGVVTQLTRYLRELGEESLARGRYVRGIIISEREDETVAASLAGRTDIEWYRVRADLKRVWPR